MLLSSIDKEEERIQSLVDKAIYYYPFITRDAVEYKLVSYDELLITNKYGENFLYNDTNNAFRTLSSDDDISKNSFIKEFGLKLSTIMWDKGIGGLELADMTGLTPSQISNYINGRTVPSIYVVYLISLALDCSLDDFIYRRKKL